MKNNNESEKQSLRSRMRSLSLSLRGYDSHIEINSGREVLIEGCRGILEYSDTKIQVSVGRQAVTVHGSELTVRNMFTQMIVIIGRIASVEYS